MIKKREEKRIPFRKLIICKCGKEMHPGFTQDVSQHGIGIQTMQYPSLNHKVRIALAVEQDSIFLDGEVRWARESSDQHEVKPREIGIYIRKPPADYLRLVAECSDRSRPRHLYEPLK
ncbi:MAG: PilZ domain-containing protein [Acidobacteria bacterium]|nr:PilZ domain-containing protein [Acidobacteriota bacterium]MBU4404757.1 PilZ domain-containing protein [Acidobacteriota bacterium]MCG2812069.1 PilZ domain-containing protein [Candidatus Aminicenantes bacterium]